MSMRSGRTLSPEELGEAVSTLVKVATGQQDDCDALLRRLETAVNDFAERTRDMPNKIAQQAAQQVVERTADLVAQRVADVLRPAEEQVQTLLRAMEEAVAAYRSAAQDARNAVKTCIIRACIWGSVSACLVVLAMKMAGIV